MYTQVCIIGGGPSGLLLSQLLHLAGIETVILERQTRDHVLSRIRAGVLEWGTVDMLERAQASKRMHEEGFPHDGVEFALQNRSFRVDFKSLIDKRIMVYGQTEVTRDLYEARDAAGGTIIHEAQGVALHDFDGEKPHVTYVKDGTEHRIDCDFIAGCDGFHGVSRASAPKDRIRTYEKVYPFGWLGVLSQTKPVADELIYAHHRRGFALASMRNQNLSRYYIQVPADDPIGKWTDSAFWDELRRRLPNEAAEQLETGVSLEKNIVPLRSFVAEPMRFGRMFLVGDAAHIVPPTGAKGLNLAVSDVHYLYEALTQHYQGDRQALDRYSPRALARAWQAMRFSWWMTTTLHLFPDQSAFDQHIQEAELDHLERSTTAQAAMAEQYVGLPF
jgi:p-hydroxybenzoate 3-monooxygenase